MPLRRSNRLNRLYFFNLFVTDLLIIAVSILLAVRIRFGSFSTPSAPLTAMTGTWAFLSISQVLAMMVENLYVVRTTVNRAMNIFRSIRMILAISVLYIMVLFITHFPTEIFLYSRLSVFYTMIIWMILTVISRLFFIPWFVEKIMGISGFDRIPVLIFGSEKMASKVKNAFRKSRVYRRTLDLKVIAGTLPDDPDLRFQYCMSVLENEIYGELVMVFEDEDFDHIARFAMLTRRRGIPFVIYSRRFLELGYFDPWLTIADYAAMTFCSRSWSFFSRINWRMADFAEALIGGLLFLPIIIPTAATIAITSRGGILYRQKRVGKNKRVFTFYKFRSMRMDIEGRRSTHKEYFRKYVNGTAASESDDEKVFKKVHSQAITPVGRIIRRTSIDELPQILNVLKGEMSIVGPRPCIDYELEHYTKEWQLQRFTVKPGLTGIWQVYGRSRLSFEKSQFLDFIYVISRTDGLNLRLILKTFPVMLFGKGGI